MKRIISVILFFTLLLGTVMPMLTACSGAVGSDKYTVGEWLKKVNEMFCLTYYTQSESLVNGVGADNEYYSAVQIAADWGVIDEGSTIKVKDKITREFCADTLVRAMDFDYDTTPDIKDADKLSCLRTVGIALNEGIMKLDNGGKFNPSKKVSKTDADIALLTAYDKWINLSYEGNEYFEAEIKDGVVNIGGLSEELSPVSCRPDDFSVSYSKKTITFDENGQMVDDIDKTVTFKNRDAMPAGVEVGTVMTLPADDVMPTSYCVKVTGITDNPDGTVTLVTSNADFFDAYEHYASRGSEELDFSQAVIFDLDGNRIELTETVEEPSNDDMSYANGELETREGLYRPSSYEFLDTKKSGSLEAKASGTYKIGNLLALQISIGSKGLDAKVTVNSVDKEGDPTGISLSNELNISDVKLDRNIDVGFIWVKKLRAVLNFKTSNTTTISAKKDLSSVDVTLNNVSPKDQLEIWENKKKEEEAQAEYDKDYNGVDASVLGASAKGLKALYDKLTKTRNSSKAAYNKASGELSTRIFNCVIPSMSGLNACLIGEIKLTLSGEITFTIKTAEKVGVERVGIGKYRIIREHKVTDVGAGVEAKVEFTTSIAFGVSGLGRTLADAGIAAGIGAKTSTKMYQTNPVTLGVEAECALPICFLPVEFSLFGKKCYNDLAIGINPLYSDPSYSFNFEDDVDSSIGICTDFKIYPILKAFACSKSTFIGKHFFTGEYSILDENDGTNYHWEIDDGVISNARRVDKCTREVNSGYNIEVGKELTLNQEVLPVALGEEGKTNDLRVVTIPKGYKVDDLEMISEDESIATVKNLLHLPEKSTKRLRSMISFLGVETTYYEDLTEVGDEAHSEIEGKKDGITMVTVRTKDGKYSAQVKLVVGNGGFSNAVIGSLMPATYAYSLDPGTTAKIELGALPGDYKPQDIVYSSQDTAVATVSASGVITAVADGMTSINIATSDGAYKTAVSVFVYVGAAAANADTSGGSAGDSAENYTAGGGGSASERGGEDALGGGSGGGTRGEAGGGSGGGAW